MGKDIRESLVRLTTALIDQEVAKILIEPQGNSEGYWFGGGNIVRDNDGVYWLCGRYRNQGDSRTGVGAGERGLELAIFCSQSALGPWEKKRSFSKNDLKHGGEDVISIEGSSLFFGPSCVDLFVSTEKRRTYPDPVRDFQKRGTGFWDIDVIPAASVCELNPLNIRPAIRSNELGSLHIKDPVAFEVPDDTIGVGILFCSHPYTWASSNTGLAVRNMNEDRFKIETFNFLERGPVWDVACTRVTDRMRVPSVGILADSPSVSLYFYDGAECLRSLEENALCASRPRGFSCEEIGGLAIGFDEAFPELHRISVDKPMFVSPHGTGCSRYVSTLVTEEGIFATWQQSQDDLSQPLVGHFLSMKQVSDILS